MTRRRLRLGPWPSVLLTAGVIVALAMLRPRTPDDDLAAFPAVQATLDRRLPEVRFDNVGLDEALKFLEDVNGVTFKIDWTHLAAIGAPRDTPVTCRLRNIPFRKALAIILDSSSGPGGRLSYEVDAHGQISISDVHPTYERQYECRDLLISFPERDADDSRLLMDDIAKLVTTTIAPETWKDAGGTLGTIRHENGVLVITQTIENHRLVANLVSKLRETRADMGWFLWPGWYESKP